MSSADGSQLRVFKVKIYFFKKILDKPNQSVDLIVDYEPAAHMEHWVSILELGNNSQSGFMFRGIKIRGVSTGNI